MNERKLKQLNILMIITAIVCAIFVLLFTFVFSPSEKNKIPVVDLKPLNDNWIVKTIKGDKDQIVDLPTKVKATAGETTVFIHIVPEDITGDTVLMFPSKFQNVVVAINEKTIYSNGVITDQKLLKSAVPCINVVEIGEYKPGDRISIYMASAYNKYSGNFGEVFYGTKGDVLSHIIYGNVFPLIISCILLVLAIALLLILIISKKDKSNKHRAVYAYIFIGMTALWNITGNPIMQIATGNTFGVYMTHMTILLVLPVLYIMLQRCFTNRVKYARIFEIGIYLFSINFLTGVIFQMLGICDFASFSIFTMGLIIVGLLILSGIMYIAAETYNDENIYKSFQTNTILLVSCVGEAILNCFSFYAKYQGLVLEIGMLIFLIVLIVFVEKDVQVRINKENEKVITKVYQEKDRITKQINTPFIYNSLNEAMLAIKGTNAKESKLIYNTSVYMKYNIKAANEKKMVPFTQELEYIKSYLNIIENTKNIAVSVEDKVVEFMVPYNTIEPLVENAVINGALKAKENGRIVVRCYERLDCFAIQIVDNGNGIGPDKRFTGIQNFSTIRSRLKNDCKASIEINSKSDRGTILTVKIPKAGYIMKE